LRVVRYRVQNSQPLKPIIAKLRDDRRIHSVQANAVYRSLARSETTKEPVPDTDPQSSQYEARGASSRPSVARSTNRTLTYERRRQQLLERIAAAEKARKIAMHKLETLERLHALAASDGILAGPHTSPRPRGVSSDIDSSRLTNLRRRCIEITIDPEGYEETLVDFCRTL
jgi:hypothetical protein